MLSASEKHAAALPSNQDGRVAKVSRRLSWRSSFVLAMVGFIVLNAATLGAGLTRHRTLSLKALGDVKDASRTGRPASWWVAHAYLERTPAPDIVVFGSSQLGGLHAADADLLNRPIDYVKYHGCYCLDQALERRHIRPGCFMVGMVGSMVSDQYVMAKALFGTASKPKLVVLTLSPRDFVDSSLPSVSATEPFRFFAPYITVAPIQSDAFANVVERASWFANQYIPLRNLLTLTQTSSDDVQMPRPNVPQTKRMKQDPLLVMKASSMYRLHPGDCVVSPHIPPMFVDNSGDYAGRYSRIGSPMFACQMRFLQRLLAELNQLGVKVVVVGMPLDSSNRALLPPSFWLNYKSSLSLLCQANNASFHDFSDSPEFSRPDFVDGVHMAASGGLKLVERIADVIASAGLAPGDAPLKASTSTPL